MNDGKIHIPARKKQPVVSAGSVAIKVPRDAYNALLEIYNESTLSLTQIAGRIILESVDRVVYDKEE